MDSDGGFCAVKALLGKLIEDFYAVGWGNGIEYRTWEWLVEFRRGDRDLSGCDDELSALAWCVDRGAPWAAWDDSRREVIPVPLEQWQERYAAWPSAKRAAP